MTQKQIDDYLRTGESDPYLLIWPSPGDELRQALIDEVKRWAAGVTTRPYPITALTRRKVQPMVNGLFPQVECDTAVATLEKLGDLRHQRQLRAGAYARRALSARPGIWPTSFFIERHRALTNKGL